MAKAKQQGRPAELRGPVAAAPTADRGHEQAWLAAIVGSSFDAIIGNKLDGTVTSWNAAAERMYGYSAAEVIGGSIEIVVPPDRIDERRAAFRRLARGGRVAPFETVRITKDGRLIDVALSLSPIRDRAGIVVGVSAIAQDISARKRAERALQRSQNQLADFVENVAVGLRWLAADGTILWANQAELDLLGYPRDEYVGQPIARFHADPPVIDDILARLARNEQLNHHEARLRCKDGGIRHVLISSNVWFEDGRFIHTRCITTDITERKRAEILLAAQKRALELIARGGPLESVLETLVRAFEDRSIYGALGALLLLDEDGRHLRHGAAPSLPEAYNRAIDGTRSAPPPAPAAPPPFAASPWSPPTSRATPCGRTFASWRSRTACAPAGRCRS